MLGLAGMMGPRFARPDILDPLYRHSRDSVNAGILLYRVGLAYFVILLLQGVAATITACGRPSDHRIDDRLHGPCWML